MLSLQAACCSRSRTWVLIPSAHITKPGPMVQTCNPSTGDVKTEDPWGLVTRQYSRMDGLHERICLNQQTNKVERHLTSTSGFPMHMHLCVCLFIHTYICTSTHSFLPPPPLISTTIIAWPRIGLKIFLKCVFRVLYLQNKCIKNLLVRTINW